MKTSMMNKYKVLRKLFPFFILSILLIACNDEKRQLDDKDLQLDSLSRELAKYKRTSDSLKALIEKGNIAAQYPIFYGKKFDTIENPEMYIKNALKDRKDLIPLEPVVGGTMAFRDIKVLTEDWVLGVYDDGHIEGKSIYKYSLDPEGKVDFALIASRETEE